MSVQLYEGDCLEILKTLPSEYIHSVVTDPPYGLSFMGRKWDYDVPSVEIWSEVLRVLKPGGHLLSFSGTRTYHRMVVTIEDAGFEVRDQIGWLYGSGFPKSHNLDGEWEGWGTALKPGWEPVCMARKPFKSTVAANVLAHGTGAMNIDGCRVGTDIVGWGGGRGGSDDLTQSQGRNYRLGAGDARPVEGRWPANVIHDGSDEVMEAFAAFGERTTGALNGNRTKAKTKNAFGEYASYNENSRPADTGTAARFYYCAKASKADRCGSKHPTVKPVALMRYLCKLVTPPDGIILDPFAGTGTTGQAAIEEGFDVILIEREAEYCDDIRARLALFMEPIPALDPTTPSPQSQTGTSPDANPSNC